MPAGFRALRPCEKIDQILGSFPAAGHAGESSGWAGFLQAFNMLYDIRRDQSGYRFPMTGNQDRSSLLHLTDAVREMSLRLNNRKVSGHVYPPSARMRNDHLDYADHFLGCKEDIRIRIFKSAFLKARWLRKKIQVQGAQIPRREAYTAAEGTG
jgi:hypothetical protein